MKMSMQEKIADLERRIMKLEQRERVAAPTTTTRTTTVTTTADDLEPEMSALWKSFDGLMKKAFKW